jgi:hypothetical protein
LSLENRHGRRVYPRFTQRVQVNHSQNVRQYGR